MKNYESSIISLYFKYITLNSLVSIFPFFGTHLYRILKKQVQNLLLIPNTLCNFSVTILIKYSHDSCIVFQ